MGTKDCWSSYQLLFWCGLKFSVWTSWLYKYKCKLIPKIILKTLSDFICDNGHRYNNSKCLTHWIKWKYLASYDMSMCQISKSSYDEISHCKSMKNPQSSTTYQHKYHLFSMWRLPPPTHTSKYTQTHKDTHYKSMLIQSTPLHALFTQTVTPTRLALAF